MSVAVLGGPSRRSDLDETERVGRARVRVGRGHHTVAAAAGDRGHLCEDRQAERLFGPLAGPQARVEPLQDEREREPGEQPEQAGEEHAHRRTLRQREALVGRRRFGRLGERGGRLPLELRQGDRCGPVDRELGETIPDRQDRLRRGITLLEQIRQLPLEELLLLVDLLLLELLEIRDQRLRERIGDGVGGSRVRPDAGDREEPGQRDRAHPVPERSASPDCLGSPCCRRRSRRRSATSRTGSACRVLMNGLPGPTVAAPGFHSTTVAP